MFSKQNRTVTATGRARPRSRLSYANVTASLALFVALGGTAAAAVTLPRDSVGARQIRTDAVRSPKISKDAVRSPEITKDAVRSSEIQDESIKLADVANGTATALRGDLHIAEDDNKSLEPVEGNRVSTAGVRFGQWAGHSHVASRASAQG